MYKSFQCFQAGWNFRGSIFSGPFLGQVPAFHLISGIWIFTLDHRLGSKYRNVWGVWAEKNIYMPWNFHQPSMMEKWKSLNRIEIQSLVSRQAGAFEEMSGVNFSWPYRREACASLFIFRWRSDDTFEYEIPRRGKCFGQTDWTSFKALVLYT